MDERAIMDYFNLKFRQYSTLSHRAIVHELKHKVEVDIEEEKNIIFRKRLDFFTLAKSLRVAMEIQTGYKQLKRYFRNEIGLDETEAKSAADRYNAASRTYDKFPVIIQNVAEFPKIDIRDLPINELPLAVNKSWLRIRSASVRCTKRNDDTRRANEIDWNNVNETVQSIAASDWYKKAERDPNLVAYIMHNITNKLVGRSQYVASRR